MTHPLALTGNLIPPAIGALEMSDANDIRRTKRSFRPTMGVLYQVTLYSLATLGLVTLISRIAGGALPVKPDSWAAVVDKSNTCDCGRTVTEAIARGCEYDLMAAAWLPSHCRDDELSAEFDKAGPGASGEWQYVSASLPFIRTAAHRALTVLKYIYTDSETRVTLNKTQISALAGTDAIYWATREWHIVHCYYYWLKLWRAKTLGTVIEKRYDNEGHIRHCGMVFRNRRVALDKIETFQTAELRSDR